MDIVNNIFKIKLLEDSVYFKCAFILWGLMHSLSLGQYVTSYASPIILLWGGLLVVKTVFIDKIAFRDKKYIFLYAFLFAYVITIFINRDLNFIGNVKTLFWCIIMILALFINDNLKDKEQILNDISRIAKVVIIASLIISGIGLIQFCFNINFWVTRVDGPLIPQGYYAARLWGIYVDPNQACNVTIISIMLSLVLYLRNIMLSRKLLVTNIVVQYLFLVLSGSRGGEIGLVFVLICLFYLLCENLYKNKIENRFSRKIISVVLSIIMTLALISTFGITRKTVALIPSNVYSIKQKIEGYSVDGEKKGPTNITVERPDNTSSNGRAQLWKDGFKLSKEFPMFGVGDRNIMIEAENLMPGSSITKQYVHNGFIHMLLSGGLVSVIIMMSFIIYIALVALKKIICENICSKEYYIYSIIAIMIGSILLTTVFLTEIFYQNSFTASIFWIFMGYLVYFQKNETYSN